MAMKSPIQRISNETGSDSIIIVGIVRDIAKSIYADIERLSKAFIGFASINWFLVESGSSDNSRQVLSYASEKYSRFEYISISNNPQMSRTENMAAARNIYLDYLKKNDIYKQFKYVVIADFNNLNNKLTVESISSCFRNNDWDIVTANQSGRYYDIWALRHPLWSPNDCWEQHAFYRKYLRFPERAISYSIRTRMIRIPQDSEWISVESAFGGLAICKSSIFSFPASYSGSTPEGKRICEHVPFHETLRQFGIRIFINPAMINNRFTDHSLRVTWAYTLLRVFTYPIKILTNRKG